MLRSLMEKLSLLDPFRYVDKYVMPVVNPHGNQLVEDAVNIVFAVLFAFVLYNFVLSPLLGTETPLVIVFSGSMEPTLFRGDVAVLHGVNDLDLSEADVNFSVGDKPLLEYAELGSMLAWNGRDRVAGVRIRGEEFGFDEDGPIIVYHSPTKKQDIIHRAVLKLNAPDGSFVITQGDNVFSNNAPDQACRAVDIDNGECISPTPIQLGEIKGKYLFHIPIIGWLKLIIFDDIPRILFGS